MALLAYAYFVPRGLNWNADSHLDLTRALVDHHSAVIDAYQVDLGDKSFYHGHWYSDKAPGLSFLAVVPYAVLRAVLAPPFFGSLLFVTRYLITVLVVSLPAALAVAALWRRLRPYLGGRWAALGALGWALGTPAFAFSAEFFSHQVCALLLLAAFLILSLPSAPGDALPAPRARMLLVAGLCCGVSVACEYPTALLGAVLAGGRVLAQAGARGAARSVPPKGGAESWEPRGLRQRRGWTAGLREGALLGAGILVGVAPALLYNALVFGGPLVQSYTYVAGRPQFVRGMAQGLMGVTGPSLAALWGITLSPYRGLLLLCPYLLLAVPGLGEMWAGAFPSSSGQRTTGLRPAALICIACVAVYALFNVSYYAWNGGFSLGPRHFVPALPFLVVPAAFALRRRIWRRVAYPLLAFSVLTMVVAMATAPLFDPTLTNPLYSWAWPALLAGRVDNNWGFFLGLRGVPSLLPLLLLEAALGVLLARRLTESG
jgi:hypothetical protein